MGPILLGLIGALFLSACNLAGDITPPPGLSDRAPVQDPSVSTPAPVSLAPPATLPDLATGASIYAARCAQCHGQDGLGDGPQASDLPVAPSALADPRVAAEAPPRQWFEVVTQGRMDRFMPPFTSLTAQQRWDVVGYALSLSIADASESASLFAEYCAECHGPAGEGSETGPSLVQPAEFALRSQNELAEVIRGGVDGSMPSFGDQLEEGQVRRLAAYVQSLAFDRGSPPVEAEDELDEEAPGARTAWIRGQVVNGMTGDPVSDSLSVTLHAFDGQEQVLTETAEVGSSGEFSFPDLEAVPGRLYVVSADYQGVRYISDVAHIAEEQPTELSLSVYETTSDPSAVVARRVHVLVDRPVENSVRVVELWIFVNEGEKTVAPVEGEGGLEIALPAGASDIRFEDSLLGERYQPTELGFRLTTPLRPGGEGAQVVFSFELPLGGAESLVQPMTVPVEAVTVLVAEGGPGVVGPSVRDAGTREAAGETFHQYDLGSRQAGEALQLQLEGPPLWQRMLPRSFDVTWAVGAAVLLAALTAVAWWYRPWIAGDEAAEVERSDVRREQRRRSLLEAIAELDDGFARGEVEKAAYQHRRNELKAELIQLIEDAHD